MVNVAIKQNICMDNSFLTLVANQVIIHLTLSH